MSEAPAAQSTWVEERLEHRFEVAVQLYNELSLPQQQIVLNAQEYAGGRLDWSTFDVRAGATMAGTASSAAWANKVITFQGLPTPIEFPGMPVPRYWEMAEGRVDLSRLEPAADDLGRMLLMEFALIYSNDWQVIPIEAPVGTILRVSSLTATDTFGTVTSIPASPAVGDSNNDWGMYQLSVRDAAGATVLTNPYNTPLFLLPPVVGQLTQGPLIEQVRFMRDEMANLAWAVERTVPSALGKGLDRLEDEKARRRARATEGEGQIAVNGTARYKLGSSVPRFWLPLMPVPAVDRTSCCSARCSIRRRKRRSRRSAPCSGRAPVNRSASGKKRSRARVHISRGATSWRAGATARHTCGSRAAKAWAAAKQAAVCASTSSMRPSRRRLSAEREAKARFRAR